MTNQANAKQAIGSTLGAVVSMTSTVGNLFDTLNKSVAMGNKYVTEASIDQDDRSKIHRHTYRKTLKQNAAMQIAAQQRQILDYCNDDMNKTLFTEALSDIESIEF